MKLTNKEAADVIMHIQIQLGRRNGKMLLSSALLKAVEVLRETPEWIPVTTRTMTEVEEKDACERLGVDHLGDYEKSVFTCPLPDDGQEILISTRWGLRLDTCDYDPDYGFGLEENGDWDGVLAWMPLPKPYEKEGESDADS